MKILVKDNIIYAIAENISHGRYENEEKWRLADSEDNVLYYMIDSDFTLVDVAEIPSDYEDGKYFYENGGFVLNEDWSPYVSPEERIAILEETVALQDELLITSDEAVVYLYEMHQEQSEINDAQDEAITGLYELMLS